MAGCPSARLGERAAPIQIIQRVSAVPDVHDFIRQLLTCERVENQFRVTGAVFHQQYAFQGSHIAAYPPYYADGDRSSVK